MLRKAQPAGRSKGFRSVRATCPSTRRLCAVLCCLLPRCPAVPAPLSVLSSPSPQPSTLFHRTDNDRHDPAIESHSCCAARIATNSTQPSSSDGDLRVPLERIAARVCVVLTVTKGSTYLVFSPKPLLLDHTLPRHQSLPSAPLAGTPGTCEGLYLYRELRPTGVWRPWVPSPGNCFYSPRIDPASHAPGPGPPQAPQSSYT